MSRDVCFFFNDTATAEIYTLPLPDALPLSTVRTCAGRNGYCTPGGAAASGTLRAPACRCSSPSGSALHLRGSAVSGAESIPAGYVHRSAPGIA